VNRIRIIPLLGAAPASSPSPEQTSSPPTADWEENMKTQSLYPENLFLAQEPSTSVRKKMAGTIAILAILTVCGFVLWEGIQMALRQTSGHS